MGVLGGWAFWYVRGTPLIFKKEKVGVPTGFLNKYGREGGVQVARRSEMHGQDPVLKDLNT